jgi:tetratricopeptide (TPR) repeat protein
VTARRAPAGGGADGDEFFDRFRTAIGRLPTGLIRPGPPAAPEDLVRAEAALGRPLPPEYASFLRSFDGADLFHETVRIAGVGSGVPRALAGLAQDYPGELVFAEAQAGDLFTLDARGRVLRRDVGADERAVAGSSFRRWLDATLAREQMLYGPDGEYLEDLFDPSGSELLPKIALRQAERGLHADPGAADVAHARGLALLRLGRREEANEAFRRAAELDPESPWPSFDLGRTAMALGRPTEALEAFRRAAEAERGPDGARLYAWAARAAAAGGDRAASEALRAQALARDPALVEQLRRAARAAADEGDPEAESEAALLLEVIEPGASGLVAVRRLPVLRGSGPGEPPAGPRPAISGREPPPPRRAPPRRPGRAARRRPGGPNPARSR